MKRCFCVTATVFCLSAISAQAAAILEIGTVTAPRGSSGNTIEVDVTNSGLNNLSIAGFSFQINGGDGINFTGANFSTSAPYLFAGNSFDQATGIPLNVATGSSLLASDISNSGVGVMLSAGQTAGLALVTFDVLPSAKLGSMTITFSIDPSITNISDEMGNAILIETLLSGTINVLPENAVPEPAADTMITAALVVFGAWRLAPTAIRRASKYRGLRKQQDSASRST